MTNEPSISRRNFFGIGKRDSGANFSPSAPPQDPPAYHEPVVEECTVSMDKVSALLEEIQREGMHIQIGVRRRDPADMRDGSPAVLEVERLLREHRATAVQIRYRFGGRLWIDTFTPVADSVRIVRVQHPIDQ